MRPTRTFLPAATLSFAAVLAPIAAASPFDASLVAADAEWVVHVDLEAVLASKMGAFLMDHADDFGAEMEHLDQFKEQFGIDPFQAIYGVTVYGSGEPGDDPIIVLVGSQDIANAMDKATEQENSPVAKTLRGFSVDGELEIAVFEGRGGVAAYIISEDVDLVDDGSKVITGQRSNLADAKWGRLRPVDGKGTLVLVSVAGEINDFVNGHGADMGPAGAFLDGAQGFSATIAELGGDVTISVGMTAADEKKASGLSQMMTGLVTMARGLMQMQVEDEDFQQMKQFAGLLDGLNIGVDGRDVSLSFSYDVDALIELIQHADF